MKPALVIRLIVFILLFVAFIVGILTVQPLLTASYICLAPFAGIWLGRATVGLFKKTRFAVLNDREQEALYRMRARKQE